MKVSTYTTIINTIENDSATFEWLNYFLWQPQVKLAWERHPSLHALAHPLKMTEALEIIYKILILLSLGAFIANHLVMILLAILPLSGLLTMNQRAKKKIVVKIAGTLLKEEFDELFFEEKTLYYLTELLSKKYNTHSLLDCIYFTENVFRAALIGLFLLFISPFFPNNILNGVFLFGLLFLLCSWTLSSHHIYHFSKILQAI
ncbi:MAG TPA: hypothetical protein PLD92_04895 [Candidatus Omnitrophota bacterium]|nr:hypothetical protein [Candidatus Omnitrophota bacterium]